jgi:hypothetical protein
MDQPVSPWVLIGFNVLLGVASFLGAMWLRRMEQDMRDMQTAHQNQVSESAKRELALHEKLQNYVAKDDFREFRDEQRENFREVFNRIDALADRLPAKVT